MRDDGDISDPKAMAIRHAQGLAEIAEMCLSLARDLHGRALAAETPEEADRLTLAFHRAARSARQSFALEARLAREGRRAAIEEARGETQARAERTEARRRQLRATLTRMVWTEAERCDAEPLLAYLNRRIDEDSLYADFADETVETHVERLREDLGLPANDAPCDPPPEDVPRQSSA